MATILGWFLYLSIPFSVGCDILSAKMLMPLYLGIFRLQTALEKNAFNDYAFFSSSVDIISPGTKVIFSFDFTLSESNGLIVCQNFLSQQYLSHSGSRSSPFLFFLIEKHKS